MKTSRVGWVFALPLILLALSGAGCGTPGGAAGEGPAPDGGNGVIPASALADLAGAQKPLAEVLGALSEVWSERSGYLTKPGFARILDERFQIQCEPDCTVRDRNSL